jgi:peptidoglycan/LPS O-acetylase OafA/YrhL
LGSRAAPSPAPTAELAHIPALDGLRGCAILAVLLLHLTSAFDALPASAATRLLKQAGSFGWSGVDLFFVLSGFLITGILADAKGTPGRFRTFYARRALRILPLYYGFLLLLFAVPALLGARTYTTPLDQQLPYWLYLQNIWWLKTGALEFSAHLWTLAIEEQFYLVWPLVIFTLSRRNALRVCLACIAGALAFRLGCIFTVDDLRVVYFLTPARMDCLATGGAIALIARGPGGWAGLRRWGPWVIAAAFAVLAAAPLHPSGFNPGGVYMTSVGYTALPFFFGALLVMALDDGRPPLPRLLSGRVLRFFGRYSYGLYVIHVPLITLARLAGITPNRFAGTRWEFAGLLGYMALMLAATLLLALASFHLYERPFLQLKSRFTYAGERRSPENVQGVTS